ncbi:hypothetical protein LOAG_01055 [Loa loa]|uniref:Uncharacterized protein n=1 Tax=Loa loa TaxID=7209 RepID=A0A1S0UAJ8_LOALO|nr:hypothetical protein LOAG_01055 [Loa loa]EFO27419.2 hypothetical protein LOAG_01055 [Loa loa]
MIKGKWITISIKLRHINFQSNTGLFDDKDEASPHIQWVPIVQRNFTEMIYEYDDFEVLYQNTKMDVKRANERIYTFKQQMQKRITESDDGFMYSSTATKLSLFNDQKYSLFAIWPFITPSLHYLMAHKIFDGCDHD